MRRSASLEGQALAGVLTGDGTPHTSPPLARSAPNQAPGRLELEVHATRDVVMQQGRPHVL